MEWHKIFDPNSQDLDRLAERYHLHPLHIEDCRHRNQSAKVEEDPGYIFTVMKGVRLNSESALLTADLDIFLGSDFVITVVEDDCPEMRNLLEQVTKASGTDPRADQVYYRIIDQTVDTYLPVLDHYSEGIDTLEDEALEAPTPQTLAGIFSAKRNLIVLRRVLVNTRDVAAICSARSRPTSAATCGPSCAMCTTTWRATWTPWKCCATCSPARSTSTCPASPTAPTR